MTGHTLPVPLPGDRIIFERVDGRYDVREVSTSGAHETHREGLTFEAAREIARGQLDTSHQMWICHHSSQHSFELFTARARSRALTSADALMSIIRHGSGQPVRAYATRRRDRQPAGDPI
jgi:hypothetical protein